ncbi:hypothetical protein FLJC2902T_17510 [Flavobacterium limnosediminis JC2902]|uniref:Uncharacterized protein n=1 Tax=Flavobacterium limnosediminis JC2902 TaxID=1341181 RepID=V6SPL6_9FLAO|nr:hypothetical protein [Flavobacterium limnosediminis]ESU28394.1 hypothetical protein FLJC2902T_17510 [Flavobacterium limnosediminis JC2902]
MKKLGNPIVVAAATPAGQKAIEKSIDIIPFLLKGLVIAGVGYFIYYKITHKFDKRALNPNYPPANISDASAQSRAEAIYTAMYGAGNGFEAVKQQLNGVNYNGFTKIYNAFGIRKSFDHVPLVNKSEGNLIEWLYDQFDPGELAELRFLVAGVFKQVNTDQ